MKELSKEELQKNEGGFAWVPFVLGALAGGLLYDVAKSMYSSAVEGYGNAASKGYYVGMPSPSFAH